MAGRKIEVQIIGDASKLQNAFRDAGRSANKFSGAMRGIGKVAAVGVGGAIVGLTAILKTGFAEMSEGQKVSAQTAAALASTGMAANMSAKQVERLASSLSLMSGVDDEAIQAAENLLLTFKNVRNETGKGNKIFARATKAALNLNVAGFGPLESTAKMLGKVLNDPIKGISALSRAGVTFTQKQKDTIKGLVETGKLLEAQKIILEEVESQVGGSAKAYGNTFPGAMAKLRNAVEGVTGALAEGLAPIVKDVAQSLSSKLTDPRFVARVRELGKEIGVKLVNAAEAIGKWFRDHWDEIKSGFRTAKDLADKLVTAVGKIKDAMQKLSDVVPGGDSTVLGAILGGAMLTKLAGLKGSVKALRLALIALTRVPWLIPISLVLLNKDAIDKWVKNKLGGFYTPFGGGLDPTDLGDWRKMSKEIQDRFKAAGFVPPKLPREDVGIGAGIGRAHGGPVMPGVSYRIGERGPETVTFGASGMVSPHGAGMVHIENLYLSGVQNARQLLAELQRMQKSSGQQTRGRHAGNCLAF